MSSCRQAAAGLAAGPANAENRQIAVLRCPRLSLEALRNEVSVWSSRATRGVLRVFCASVSRD